jgi:hypothetical protein
MSEPCDDEEARAQRARRLREQIEHLVAADPEPEPAAEALDLDAPESPRDFVHRKMRERETKPHDPE